MREIRLVVCGTRYPVPTAQKERGAELLRKLNPTTVNHGMCTGADEYLATVTAEELAATIVAFPANDVPEWFISKTAPYDFIEKPAPALERNQAMVDASTAVLALPSVMDVTARSGTWSTLRKARRAKHSLILVVGPDGGFWREGKL